MDFIRAINKITKDITENHKKTSVNIYRLFDKNSCIICCSSLYRNDGYYPY